MSFYKTLDIHLKELSSLVKDESSTRLWPILHVDTFTVEAKKVSKSSDWNKLFWIDQLKVAEGYQVLSLWRINEIIKATHINPQKCLPTLIPSAILARSALEIACVFITISASIRKACQELIKNDLKKHAVYSNLEEILIQAIWGTRKENLLNIKPHLKQKNILTYIQKLDKNPDANGLLKHYEILCEVAHPNNMGNSAFIINDPGSSSKYLDIHGNQDILAIIDESTRWALSWSAAGVAQNFKTTKDSIHQCRATLMNL